MEKKTRKSAVIGIAAIILVTLTLLGITYAYYRTRIIDNPNDESVSVTSKELEITYSDETPVMNMEGLIEPNFTYTKSFSVTNTGDGAVDYAVYLQDVVNEFKRTSDLKITITCASTITGNTCEGMNGEFPVIDSLLTTNHLELNEAHNYVMTVEYVYLEEVNQSIDMGKSIAGMLQIYDVVNTLKEGTLAYTLINNAKSGTSSTTYRNVPLSIPAQETTLVLAQTAGAEKTLTPNPDYYYAYSSEVEFNPLAGYTLVNPQVEKWSDIASNPTKLANFKYTRRVEGAAAPGERTEAINDTNKIISATANSITYQVLALTTTSEIVESTMSVTRDDYGISYYYRGDVQDNYVNYNGMCWKIVRILGDGSVKLILESTSECSTTMAKNFNVAAAPFGADSNYVDSSAGITPTNHSYTANYLNPNYKKGESMRVVLNKWLTDNNFDTTDLREGDWCLNDTSVKYNASYPYNKLDTAPSQFGNKYNYASYIRAYRNYPEQATLLCESLGGTIVDDYIGTITSDEAFFAGGKIGFPSHNYLMESDANTNLNWRTMTVQFHGVSAGSYDSMDLVYGNGSMSAKSVSENHWIRPAIILNNTVEYNSGNGTVASPYTVK